MTLAAGTHLGPYEILSPLGAGGMGEVYRARDTRLGREVAVKVLPESLASNPDALSRFQREARAVAALSHPNILGIFDFGTDNGLVYAVMELLEGESLRDRLSSGPIPVRKAVELSSQIARGLAAAHERGIVHRDLKPDNVFIAAGGHVKILDFGLAIEVPFLGADKTKSPTISRRTDPGTVLGTVGYMSPEQVRGKTADQRSDIFSFGCLLYEMLSGERAFFGDSAAETMAAIAQLEPPELAIPGSSLAPALERIVAHCLEKRPEERFQSARDIAFALEASLGTSTGARAPASLMDEPPRARRTALAAAALLLVVAGAVYLAGHRSGRSASASLRFTPMTFRREPIFNARFAPDGQTIAFSAAPAGNAPRVFSLRPGVPGASAVGVADTHLLAVSSKGELAVLTRARYIGHRVFEGTLARMPLEGAAPREILDGVREADWAPDGSGLAIIREAGGKDRLEYPVGKVLREVGGYLSNPRFSPRGDRIAFFEHPVKWDDRGLVAVVDLQGRRTLVSDGYSGEEGLTWSPDGREILFSAGIASENVNVFAADLAGNRRVLARSAGDVTIQDATRDGRWLVSRDESFWEMPVVTSATGVERDLSWLDLSDPVALTPDGRKLLFTESSGSLGVNYATCLRGTDGSPVVRLGEGLAQDLSRDGKWALAVVPSSPQQLVVYPTGAGEVHHLDRGGLVSFESARFFPDGSTVLACGHEEKQAVRCFVQPVAGGPPRAVTPEGTADGFVSPDGRTLLVRGSGEGLTLYPLAGGVARRVPGAQPEDRVILWRADGRSIFVGKSSELPAPIERLDLTTGARSLERRVGPSELAGVLRVGKVAMSENEASYAYSVQLMVSQLFLVEGAR